MTLVIEPLDEARYEQVLPLIADYQRFYGAEPDPGRNAAFFRRFLEPSEHGLLLGAWRDGELAGYACLYWTFSSVTPAEVVLLNDLFVAGSARGGGAGRALIDAALDVARRRGAARLEWRTALDNRRAQRLYELLPAERTAWFSYEIAAA